MSGRQSSITCVSSLARLRALRRSSLPESLWLGPERQGERSCIGPIRAFYSDPLHSRVQTVLAVWRLTECAAQGVRYLGPQPPYSGQWGYHRDHGRSQEDESA